MNRNYANKQAIRFRFGEQCQINTVYLLIYIFIKLLAKYDYKQNKLILSIRLSKQTQIYTRTTKIHILYQKETNKQKSRNLKAHFKTNKTINDIK